jgi:GT2 family glycosyltransferase
VPAPPSFTVVVPTFRRLETLLRTLAALRALDYDAARYEIVVVDDGNEAAVETAVRDAQGNASLRYERGGGRGAAAARNLGAAVASGDLLLFCDDDILVPHEHLMSHLEARAGHEEECLVNGEWMFSEAAQADLRSTPFGRFRLDLTERFQAELRPPRGHGPLSFPDALTAANLSIARSAFDQLGGFDEDFPYAGAEDRDFSMRARQAGYLLVRDQRIQVIHDETHIDRRQYCAREERGAQTVAVLVRKHPGAYAGSAWVRENGLAPVDEPLRLRLKKAVKLALGIRPVLSALHRLTDGLERARLPERQLRRVYKQLLAVHIFRGFRRKAPAPPAEGV